ncbi:MAG: anti-sigma factor family protein, partial [Pyrinomonadaceae bacterium]
MNCENYLLTLDEYVENELDEKSAAQISSHIADCAACANQYEILRREQQIYSQCFSGIEASVPLWANIQADIEKIQRKRFSLKNFRDWLAKTFDVSAFNPAFAAVPIVLLVTLGIIVGLIKYKSAENSFSGNVISQKGDTQSSPEKTEDNSINKIPNFDQQDDISKPGNRITSSQVRNRVKRIVPHSDLPKPTNQFVSSKSANSNRKLTTDEAVAKAEQQY